MQTPSKNDRDMSKNTIQMLNDSGDYMDRSNEDFKLDLESSKVEYLSQQENDPKKLRDFYIEFCNAVQACKRMDKDEAREEINLHDLLVHMGFISVDTAR